MDESTFTVPQQWWPHIHARRGGWLRPAPTPDPHASQVFRDRLAEYLPRWQPTLDNPASDPALVTELHDYMAGKPSPAGAAVAANMVLWTYPYQERHVLTYVADAWVAQHGLTFAARAAAELGRVQLEPPDNAPKVPGAAPAAWELRAFIPDVAFYGFPADGSIIKRVRTLLAVASDEDYDAAIAALDSHRADHQTRMLVSYLVPTRQDWVDELCDAAVKRGAIKGHWDMLLCSIGTPDQLATISTRKALWLELRWMNLLHTLTDGLGPAVAPVVAQLLDQRPNDEDILAVLVELPTDEAFGILLDRLDTKHAPTYARTAADRYPKRALRMLTDAADGISPRSIAARQLLDSLQQP